MGAEPPAVAVRDSTDLRSGAPLHDALLALVPLVGVWRGTGDGVVASTGAQFRYGQQVRFAHDGRPFLAYESRSWLLGADGAVLRLAWRESGFWRPGAGPDDIEVVLASNTGQSLLYSGTSGDRRWEIATAVATPTPTARVVDGERRLYALLGGTDTDTGGGGEQLAYATELAPAGVAFAPHLNARLSRVRAHLS